jgi:hypothetical protein
MSTYESLSPVEKRAADFQLAALQRMLVVRKARLPLSVLPAPQSISDSTCGRAPVPCGAGVFSIPEYTHA